MKIKNLFLTLISLATLFFVSDLHAQVHTIVLNVDVSRLDPDEPSKACAFTASSNTEVVDNNTPEDFMIEVNVNDEIIWEAVSNTGEEIDIESVDFDLSGGKEKPFKDKKLRGNGNGRGKKKAKGKVHNRAKGNEYKYTIEFTVDSENFFIDPKIRIRR